MTRKCEKTWAGTCSVDHRPGEGCWPSGVAGLLVCEIPTSAEAQYWPILGMKVGRKIPSSGFQSCFCVFRLQPEGSGSGGHSRVPLPLVGSEAAASCFSVQEYLLFAQPWPGEVEEGRGAKESRQQTSAAPSLGWKEGPNG